MKRDDFLRRHNEGPMIRMPNAWDKGHGKNHGRRRCRGTGTTARFSHAQGLPDYEGALTRDEFAQVRRRHL